MSKHLMLSPDAALNWTLPANADVEKLKTKIEDAMIRKEAVRISVQLPDGGTHEVILNGAVLPYAAVVEVADQS